MTKLPGETKGAKCPRCQGFKDVRRVPTEHGYDPDLEHWCCDFCKIGWYQWRGHPARKLSGSLAAAKAAYVPKE